MHKVNDPLIYIIDYYELSEMIDLQDIQEIEEESKNINLYNFHLIFLKMQ